MENNLFSFINMDNNTIRGSYGLITETPYNSYIYNLQELIDEYDEEKIYMECQLQNLINKNSILSSHINFLNKKYYRLNVTHNNTINFIIKNNQSLKLLLDRLTYIYDKNIYDINLIKEKIYIINSNINIYCNQKY